MIKQSKTVGRNPFEKNRSKANIKEVKTEKRKTADPTQQLKSKFADWLFIALPAKTYVLGLKTVLLTKSIFKNKV